MRVFPKSPGRDGGLNTLCHSHGFACQQRVPKTFLGPDDHRSENDILLLRYFLENLGICSSQFYLATSQFHYLIVIGMDGSLSTLCHSRGVPCQQRVLKRCPDPGYLRSRIV